MQAAARARPVTAFFAKCARLDEAGGVIALVLQATGAELESDVGIYSGAIANMGASVGAGSGAGSGADGGAGSGADLLYWTQARARARGRSDRSPLNA
jgi:hypothetical protein